MWNYDNFKEGSFVEVVKTSATDKWGVTVRSKDKLHVVRSPARGIVIEIFVDDLSQKYANVLFDNGIIGHIYINTLHLLD